MPELDVLNWWAVIAATAAYFVLGALWYSVFFGKAWMTAANISPDQVEQGANPLVYVVQAVQALLLMLLLTYLISDVFGTDSILNGIHVALMVWLFMVFGMSKDYIWEPTRGWTLAAINFGYPLVGLIIGGILISGWT